MPSLKVMLAIQSLHTAEEDRVRTGLLLESAPAPTNSLWVPVFGFAGVVLGAVVAALFASHRERVARREESQRSALYEMQDAAVQLRKALRAYGKAGPSPDTKLDQKVDARAAALEMYVQRVICDTVQERVNRWKGAAEGYFMGDEAFTVRDEQRAWALLQEAVGQELRHLAN